LKRSEILTEEKKRNETLPEMKEAEMRLHDGECAKSYGSEMPDQCGCA
jgi:hypothetical protein